MREWLQFLTTMDLKDYLLYGLVPLTASYIGAWLSGRFESRRNEAEERKRNIGSLNLAVLTISAYWNMLADYQKKELNDVRGDEFRWIHLQASATVAAGKWSFQMKDLQFLLHSDFAPVAQTMMLEQVRFYGCIDLIRKRSRLILERLQPAMAAHGIRQGQSISEQEIVNVAGMDVVHQLKAYTEGIFQQVDENLKSLQAAYGDLQKAARMLYPNTKFLVLQFG